MNDSSDASRPVLMPAGYGRYPPLDTWLPAQRVEIELREDELIRDLAIWMRLASKSARNALANDRCDNHGAYEVARVVVERMRMSRWRVVRPEPGAAPSVSYDGATGRLIK